MTRILVLLALTLATVLAQVTPAPGTSGQVKIGCTPDSMSAALAGSLAAKEMGRWNCYALNVGPAVVKLSQVAFALEFMELHQISPADVNDIFTTKQKMSKTAKAVRVLEWVGMTGVLIMGQSYVKVGADVVSIVATASYGSGKIADYLSKQVPPTANALSGMWQDEVLTIAPGEGKRWKVYASRMKGAKELGPKLITLSSASVVATAGASATTTVIR